MQESVRLQQRELGAITNRELKEHLASLAYKSTGAADKIMGLSVNTSAMKLFSGTAWSGNADFSQRIWQNTDKLADYLNNDIANGFARGDSYERLISHVRSRFINVAKNDAYRLIYTEGTYVMNESSAAVFAEDFEDYEFQIADSNACPVCKALNGKKFKFSQRVPGRNFPPMHPWCRCHFGVAVDDWDKWQDEYVERHGGNVSQETLNGLYNSFNQGDLIPITPEAIQNIKSFDVPELGWRENQQLKVAMQKLLERVKNEPLGTEYLHYYDMHMNFLHENKGKDKTGKVEDDYHPPYNYLIIHNHPDGGTISPGDVDRMVENEHLQIVIAVGNNGKQYLISKTKSFDGKKFATDYIDYMKKAKSEVKDLETFITKANEFVKTKGAKYGYRYREK